MSKGKFHQHRHHDYEQESEQFYDHIADHFDHSFDGFLASFFKKFILKNLTLTANTRLLDVGCANGRLLEMLNQKTKIFGVGLDISSEMVRVATARFPEFTFVQGKAEHLPFAANSFDLLTCSASFHHFPNPEQFLQEAKRLLDENGRLVIAEIHIPLITKAYNWRLNRYSTEGDVKVYSPKELTQLFEKNGWKITKKKIFLQIQYYELQRKC
ncbi:class I SAM-dependent methyltransferase [Lactococcus kimchii]|uniref:class I SAM-dependent methyltransferase n=1 Tax=Lactococcus sp. S-13 TaxID=2507158 RepID=UPI0010233261|nr:class I SAM-dependent methyltransferase [Lactococcus sp. S-13]RZI48271.1 class I SAM-dependent methyltransferase [Lactococcus sp. S-13]